MTDALDKLPRYEPELQNKRRIRILRLAEAMAEETPIPSRPELAARFGVSVSMIAADLATIEFARQLEERIAANIGDHVPAAIQMHLAVMNDPEAKHSDRLTAARWLYARWAGAKRAAAAVRGGDEPAQVVAAESELLAQVMRETQEQREQKK